MNCHNKDIFRPGALCPVEATDDMTQPVGQKDGQLYVAPTGGIPPATAEQNGYVAMVLNGAWVASDFIPSQIRTLQGDVLSLGADTANIQATVDEIYNGMIQIVSTLNAINRTVVV